MGGEFSAACNCNKDVRHFDGNINDKNTDV